MPRGKSQAPNSKAERGRKNTVVIQEAVAKQAAEWAQDPDVLDALPASNKASLLMQFLPKAQPVDQDLEQNMLQLSNLLTGLPDSSSLTAELARLKGENKKLTHKMKVLKKGLPKDNFEEFVDEFADAFIQVGRQFAGAEIIMATKDKAADKITWLNEK